MSLGQQQKKGVSADVWLLAAKLRGLVCCADPCEGALAKQIIKIGRAHV